MSSRSIKITAILLLFGIAFLNYNAFANGHYHIGPNGHIIYHAHPHHTKEKTPPLDHEHHSRIQLLIYSSITTLHILLISLFILLNILLFFQEKFRNSNEANFGINFTVFLPSRRGPPQFDL